MTAANSRRRPTIRRRLTALYAGAFFLAGAVLICLMYLYLQQSLHSRPVGVQGVVSQFLDDRGVRNRPVVDALFRAIAAESERERQETLRAMLMWSGASLGVVGVAAGVFGWLMAGRALAPLQDVTATARRVADRNLHERIALDGPDDEIKELADTFDAMLDRLDRAFEGQRRFVANASHELRTPLAINRTLIEVALEDPDVAESTRTLARTLLDVNLRNERLIEGLLVLASSDQRILHRSRVDLGEVTGRAVATAAPHARASGIRTEVDLHHACVRGDPALLERLAQNLVDNALRYNISRDGWVTVTVCAQDGFARLRVQNSGPPIAAVDVPDLFEPFRRLGGADRVAEDKAPGRGAGLGLSIVRSVAAAHGGDVHAEARPEGGLDVVVTLPGSQ